MGPRTGASLESCSRLRTSCLVPLNEFKHSVRSIPGKAPAGRLASSAEWTRALGQVVSDQRLASCDGGRVQQCGSGHFDVERLEVPRPRNHLTCSYGVSMATANGS